MRRVIFLCTFIMLAIFYVLAENVPNGDLVVMTEKVVITSGGHENPPKSPDTLLYIYQSDNVFFFGESYEGCIVSLLLDDVTVFSTIVDENGQVVVPSSFAGVFELQLTVDNVTYWAEVQL